MLSDEIKKLLSEKGQLERELVLLELKQKKNQWWEKTGSSETTSKKKKTANSSETTSKKKKLSSQNDIRNALGNAGREGSKKSTC